jgi:medium-chain acyl-[acyl-carrier-protein] hydrolase
VSAHRAPQLCDEGGSLHTKPEGVFIEELSMKYGGLPKMIADDPELTRLYLPTLRADIAVCETYEYQAAKPLNCSISVSGGLQDNQVSPGDLEAWKIQTNAQFCLRMFKGDHFFIKSAQSELLRTITDDMARTYVTLSHCSPSHDQGPNGN